MVDATPRPLYPRERANSHCTGDWLSRRVRKISSPPGIRSPDRSARSDSLYRLHYPVPLSTHKSSFRKQSHSDCFLIKTWEAFLVSITRATPLYRPGSVFTSRFLCRQLYSGTTRWSSPLCRRKEMCHVWEIDTSRPMDCRDTQQDRFRFLTAGLSAREMAAVA